MQTTRQRIDGTNQHCHNARHFSEFELRMGKTSPETIVFRETNYLSWRLLMNENYDNILCSLTCSRVHLCPNHKKMLKRREVCDTYLTHVCRHHCNRESLVKR